MERRGILRVGVTASAIVVAAVAFSLLQTGKRSTRQVAAPTPSAVERAPGVGGVDRSALPAAAGEGEQAVQSDSHSERETVPDRFRREEGEWRGRIADPEHVWSCMSGAPEFGIQKDHCTNARACVDGMCVPCLEDGECLTHETCVLGHCLLPDLADCHTRMDCEEDDALCALTSITQWDPRGNSDLRSYCLSPWGGEEPTAEEEEVEMARQIENVIKPVDRSPSPSARAADLLRQRFAEDGGGGKPATDP